MEFQGEIIVREEEIVSDNDLMREQIRVDHQYIRDHFLHPFLRVVKALKRKFPAQFHEISDRDVQLFLKRLKGFKYLNKMGEVDQSFIQNWIAYPYDLVLEPLVKSALAHIIYGWRYSKKVSQYTEFYPYQLRSDFFDGVMANNKQRIKLAPLRLVEFAPGTLAFDGDSLYTKIRAILQHPILCVLIEPSIKSFLYKSNAPETLLENPRAHGDWLLYHIFMDLYLDAFDKEIRLKMQFSSDGFWARCLDIGLISLSYNHNSGRLNDELLQHLSTVCGLIVKVRLPYRRDEETRSFYPSLRGKVSIYSEG